MVLNSSRAIKNQYENLINSKMHSASIWYGVYNKSCAQRASPTPFRTRRFHPILRLG